MEKETKLFQLRDSGLDAHQLTSDPARNKAAKTCEARGNVLVTPTAADVITRGCWGHPGRLGRAGLAWRKVL